MGSPPGLLMESRMVGFGCGSFGLSRDSVLNHLNRDSHSDIFRPLSFDV